MSIEFEKPKGCNAVGLLYTLPNRDQNLTLLCGERRTDFTAEFWEGDEKVLAADAIKGLCVKCPNKNDYLASQV